MKGGRTATMLRIVLLVALAAVVLIMTRAQSPLVEGFSAPTGTQPTIFVSCASYRDTQCMQTVTDFFSKATDASRVYFGICQQNKRGEGEEGCVPIDAGPAKNVAVITMDHTEARGPTLARARIANELYAGQTYYLQIDSHSVPVQGWDSLCIQEIQKCPVPEEVAVLSHYPLHVGSDETTSGVPVLCKATWNSESVPTFESVILPRKAEPTRVPFCSGGFLFGRGHTLTKTIGFDPTLHHLFAGEEILFSARLFTHGVNVYTPTVNIIRHQYMRKGPRFWDDLPNYKVVQRETLTKVKRILGIQGAPLVGYPYGLGSIRSLQEFYAFAKLNPREKTAETEATFCK